MSTDQATEALALPDIVVIVSEISIARSPSKAWSVIGEYGTAGKYLNVESSLRQGGGEIGSVRSIGPSVLEVLVGKSEHSYTYTQTAGPMASFAYHGHVVLFPESDGGCRLAYTISYDQTSMDEAKRAYEQNRIRPRFEAMIKAMKTDAERS
jgi:hypothetical protein